MESNRKCKSCDNIATKRYTECNKCRNQRKFKFDSEQTKRCTGCNTLLEDEYTFKTCHDCLERGNAFRHICEVCGEDSFLNKLCKQHYDEFYELRNEILSNKEPENKCIIIDNMIVKDRELTNNDEHSDDESNIDETIDYDNFSTEILVPSYLGGMFDGDGSLLINKLDTGYQLLVLLSQSVTNILNLMVRKYGGYVYGGRQKGNGRTEYAYRICGKKSLKLLEDLSLGCIIKEDHVKNCIELIPSIGKKFMDKKKNEIFLKGRKLNRLEISPLKNFAKINNHYIAGIFDAEGCFGITKRSGSLKKAQLYVQISQKNHPDMLREIMKYLGFGQLRPVKSPVKWIVENINDIMKFLDIINGKIVVKQHQYIFYRQFLESREKYSGQQNDPPDSEMNLRKVWFDKIYQDKRVDRITDKPTIKPKISLTLKKRESTKVDKSKIVLKKKIKSKIENTNYIARKIIKSNHDSGDIIGNFRSTNEGTSLNIDHRLNIALAKSGKNTGLSRKQFEQIRECLVEKGETKISISDRYNCDRNLITKIEKGLLHEDEISNLDKEGQMKYKSGYLMKQLIQKKVTNSNPSMVTSINKRKVKSINILIEILLYKFKINPMTKKLYSSRSIADHYKKLDNSKNITEETVKNLWNNKSKVYEEEFGETSISYKRFKELAETKRDHKNPDIHLKDITEINLINDI